MAFLNFIFVPFHLLYFSDSDIPHQNRVRYKGEKKKETDRVTVLKDLTNWDRGKSSAQRGKEVAQLAKRLLYSFVLITYKAEPCLRKIRIPLIL